MKLAHLYGGKRYAQKNLSCSTLEAYKETHIFIPVDIAEDVIELVTWKLLGSSIPGGTYSEYLLGWL